MNQDWFTVRRLSMLGGIVVMAITGGLILPSDQTQQGKDGNAVSTFAAATEPLVRMVEDSTGEWLEFGFVSPELLNGNGRDGFANTGNILFMYLQQSEDLETWTAGKFEAADVPVVTVGDGTYEYWSRCTVPRYWKNIIADLTATTTRYGKSITNITVDGSTVTLSYPYAMPADAATLQADLRTAGLTGAVVSTSTAALSIEGINHVFQDDRYDREPITLTFSGTEVTAVSYEESPVTLPSLPYAIPAAAATLQADLRTAGLTGATIRLFDDSWTILIPDHPAVGEAQRQFHFTFTPDDPHPSWDLFGVSEGDVPDNFVTSTFDNVRPGAGDPIIPEAEKQFARLVIQDGTHSSSPPPPPLSEQTFAMVRINAVTKPRQVAGSSSTVTVDDRVLNRTVSGSTYFDQSLNAVYTGTLPEAVSWSSSNTAVATVDSNGFVTHLGSGVATITAEADGETVSRDFSMTVSSATSDTLTGFAAGSLAAHATAEVDARIVGLTPGAALPIFTTQNHGAGTYTRNTGTWPADIAAKLTCISPWNSAGEAYYAGTAISPLHIIFAAHYEIPVGATIRFIAADNTVITRTMIAKGTHPSYVPHFPDLTVGQLDSALPGTITPCKILPDNWAAKLPGLATGKTALPALCLDQEEKALITDLFTLTDRADFTAPYLINAAARVPYHETKITGDSGNPAFLIINDELVLLTVWTYGGAGGGTAIQPQRAAINALMASLGGGYTLTDADLSSFTSY